MSKRILILSQYYWPEGRTYPEDLARGLQARGHRVRVITGFPNYPSGTLMPGYRQRWRSRERIKGVPVLRVPLFVDHSLSAVRRMLNYVTFGLSSASAWAHAKNADVVYVYAPQMSAAFGPWLWRMLGGPPYVVHVQDLWPDSIIGSSIIGGLGAGNPADSNQAVARVRLSHWRTAKQATASQETASQETTRRGIARVISSVLTPWLRLVYRRAAGVIGIAPNMVRMLGERGARPERTHLVYNWSEEVVDDASPTISGRVPVPKKDARIRFVFAGNTGDMQDLETVVRAAHACRSDDLEVMIVGEGIALPRVRALAEELGADNVIFTGRVPQADVPQFYASSDFGLVTLKDLPIFRGTIPSKLQSQLASGLPIVTTVQGDVRETIERNGIGFAAEPENAESLAEALRAAAALSDTDRAALSDRALATFREQFSRDTAVNAIEHILIAAARSRRGAPTM